MTRRRAQFAARALDDLAAVGDFSARDNPGRARSFVRDLVAAAGASPTSRVRRRCARR